MKMERNVMCEAWPLTLRGKHRLRMFENRVLRNIFGPKRDKVTGEWRKETRCFMLCTLNQITFRRSNEEE
jgi:hypothetical protein